MSLELESPLHVTKELLVFERQGEVSKLLHAAKSAIVIANEMPEVESRPPEKVIEKTVQVKTAEHLRSAILVSASKDALHSIQDSWRSLMGTHA
jgi:hypothetical protein